MQFDQLKRREFISYRLPPEREQLRSMGNLLFWLGIGAAQKGAGSKGSWNRLARDGVLLG
jgi:hypothetical protein